MNPPQPKLEWPSVLELIQILRHSKRIWLAAAVAGGVVAAAIAFSLPRTYEAEAVIRMAQVDKQVVESALQAIERLKAQAFLQAARLGDPAEGGVDVLGRITVKRIRESELLEVRYRDVSPEAAQQGLNVIYELLRARQDEIAAPTVNALKEQLAAVRKLRIESVERRQELMRTLRVAPLGPIKNEYPFIQLAFVQQDNEVTRWEHDLLQKLAPPLTHPTLLIEPIVADPHPVAPKRVLMALAGALAGLLLGSLWVVYRAVLPKMPRSS